ncbi:Homeobox-leucine zipper protein HDG1 [Linum grandiflorum]
MQNQMEKHGNIVMKQDNEKLSAENEIMKKCLNDPLCIKCGGTVMHAILSDEQHQLLIENARLKEELGRVSNSLANKLYGGQDPLSSVTPPPFAPNDFAEPCMNNIVAVLPMMTPPPTTNHQVSGLEKLVFLDFALASMNELFTMVQTDDPLWIKCPDRDILNLDEYARIAAPLLRLKRSGFVTEASRESGTVMMNSFAVAEMLMNVERFVETFFGVVANSSIIDVIYCGLDGRKDGTLQLMEADFQVISPMVPARRERFLRYCKQHDEGVWVVADVSIDTNQSGSGSSSYSFPTSMRLPSGCVIQDISDGYSKVTWVEHTEYDESSIDRMLRPVISSGIGFGAKRWLSTLQRYCEFLNILMATSNQPEDPSLITLDNKKGVLRLARKMVDNFCSGVVSNGDGKWEKLPVDNVSQDVKILARKSLAETGEALGFVLAASTSVWLPFSRQRLFDFLNENSASWDTVTKDGKMHEMFRIPMAQTHGNCISLLRRVNLDDNMPEDTNPVAVLQESWHDATGSLVVHAPVSMASMEMVMSGGDHTFVGLLPTGYAIIPDGGYPHNSSMVTATDGDSYGGVVEGGGSILTVGFQILINIASGNNLTTESVDTVNNLMSCIIRRIKGTLQLLA